MNSLALHKCLPIALLPLGASLLMLAAALRWRRSVLIALPFMTLWTLGTPAVSEMLMRSLEDRYPSLAIDQCPQADAVFTFGGILGPREQPGGGVEWSDAADRFNRAVALYHSGRARVLVLSGGQSSGPHVHGEGERLREVACRRGVPNEAILVTNETINTEAEADALSRLAALNHWTRVLIVTSAFHMPRAMRLARKCPAEIVPVPVGYETPDPNISLRNTRRPEYFLPQAQALFLSERAVREYLGILFYTITKPA